MIIAGSIVTFIYFYAIFSSWNKFDAESVAVNFFGVAIGLAILLAITTAILQIYNFQKEISKKELFIDTNGTVLKTKMKINLFLSGVHSILACLACIFIILLPFWITDFYGGYGHVVIKDLPCNAQNPYFY